VKSFRHLSLILFFAGLVSLEIWHGVFRLRTLTRRQRDQTLEGIRRGQGELARDLREILRSEGEHARYLVKMPAVRALLSAAPGSFETRISHERLEGDLLPYLLAFPVIDRLALFDITGRERFRLMRLARLEEGSGGVGSLPDGLLGRIEERAERSARELEGRGDDEVALSQLEIDQDKVEVAERDRQVLRYTALVREGDKTLGTLVLTLYAAPLLDSARKWEPLPGVLSTLIDGEGRFLAHPRREKERAGAPGLREERPRAWAILGGEKDSRDGPVLLVTTPVPDGLLGWRLVAEVPDPALEAGTLSIRGEYGWVIGSMAATALILILAGAFLLRLSIREVRLAESDRQMQMERQLRISERLGSLGLLTAGVAHEINNPLEGIENYLTLLEREGGEPSKRARYLEMVRYGFRRIRDIVRDLSSFARQPEVKGKTADLARVIERALGMVRYDSAFRTVQVERRGLDRPLEVLGDAGRLEQVFINLLLNAARAMGSRGRITITASLAEGSDKSMVEVQVEDSGPGIAEEVLGKIFDPFFTTGEGTGLGLSISYGIVRAHGGELRAKNRPEGGACFTVRLPACHAPPAASLHKTAADVSGLAGRVGRRAQARGGAEARRSGG